MNETATTTEKPGNTKMLYVGGSKSSFRCDCGCNCFHQPKPQTDPTRYKCNACDTLYRSE